jgi:hypothetical protein
VDVGKDSSGKVAGNSGLGLGIQEMIQRQFFFETPSLGWTFRELPTPLFSLVGRQTAASHLIQPVLVQRRVH